MSTYDKLGKYAASELPEKVSDLVVASTTETSITLSWTNNTTAEGYPAAVNDVQIFVGTEWFSYEEIGIGEVEKEIAGLTTGVEYRLRIVVKDGTLQFPAEPVTATPEAVPVYPTAGLLARWSFDSDDLTDSSGNGKDLQGGTYDTGSASYVAGLVGDCIEKTNSYSIWTTDGDIINTISDDNSGSFGGWFSLDNPNMGDGRTGAGQYEGYIAEDNNAIGWRFEGSDSTIAVMRRNAGREYKDVTSILGGVMQASTWYHLFVTHDQSSGDQIYYLNGEVLDSSNSGEFIGTNGYFVPSDGAGDTMRLDNYYVYNRALSQGEVQQLYNLGSGV